MAVTRRRGRVPVGPFQERYHELCERGATASELAVRAGFLDRNKGDVSRLRRALGLKAEAPRNGNRRYTAGWITYETAERLMRALDMDPFEAGL